MSEAGLSDFERRIVDCVEEYGWFGLSVAPRAQSEETDEWFTYTIGLPKSHGWPELICFGLDRDTAHGMLGDAIRECESRNVPPTAGLELTEVLNGYKALLTDGSRIPDPYFGSAIWYARQVGSEDPPRRLQLLWPDKAGRFPNDPLCESAVRESQTPIEVLQ